MEYDCLGGGRGRRMASEYGVTEVDVCMMTATSPVTDIDVDLNSREILVTSKLGGAAILTSGY